MKVAKLGSSRSHAPGERHTADAWLRAGAELAARLQEELADQGYRVEYAHASDKPSRLVAARG
jgi:hypothetical protein